MKNPEVSDSSDGRGDDWIIKMESAPPFNPLGSEVVKTPEDEVPAPAEEDASKETSDGSKPGIAESLRPVAEMEPAARAREYLGLLRDLSDGLVNFGAPAAETPLDGATASSGDYNLVRDIYKQGGLELDESTREADGLGADGENSDLARARALRAVDRILFGENELRQSEEEARVYEAKHEQAIKALGDFRREHRAKGWLEKAFSYPKYRKEHQELMDKQSEALRNLQAVGALQKGQAERALYNGLRAAYVPGSDFGESDYATRAVNPNDAENKTYYQQFFSDERRPKIERALELRKSLGLLRAPEYREDLYKIYRREKQE